MSEGMRVLDAKPLREPETQIAPLIPELCVKGSDRSLPVECYRPQYDD